MAGIDTRQTRILGFAWSADLETAREAMGIIPGPEPRFLYGPSIAAVMQDEPEIPLTARDRLSLIAGLETVQRRLEIASIAGPFLPMDPSAACCPTDAVPALLDPAWANLRQSLRHGGTGHQWDISLAWSPETAVARHRSMIAPEASLGPDALSAAVRIALRTECLGRNAELLTVLRPVLLSVMDDGANSRADAGETRVTVTVLIERGRECEIEERLGAFGDDVAIEMRGPMPPVSFFSVRLVNADALEITNAWTLLDLPERVDLTALHRQWRVRAAAAHPDRGDLVAGTASVADLTAAHRLLKELMSQSSREIETSQSLLRLSGPRLVVPSPPAAAISEAALAS